MSAESIKVTVFVYNTIYREKFKASLAQLCVTLCSVIQQEKIRELRSEPFSRERSQAEIAEIGR